MNSHWEHLQTFQSSVGGIQLTGHSGPQEEKRRERKRLFLRGVVSRREAPYSLYISLSRPAVRCFVRCGTVTEEMREFGRRHRQAGQSGVCL